MKSITTNLDYQNVSIEGILHTIELENTDKTFVNDYEAAENKFVEWGISMDPELFESLNVESETIAIQDEIFMLSLTEYYVDSGSDDYVYRIIVRRK